MVLEPKPDCLRCKGHGYIAGPAFNERNVQMGFFRVLCPECFSGHPGSAANDAEVGE